MLKIYMVYSRDYGPQEGALLVFAHTVREARKVGYENGGSDITDRYIDFGACLLRDCDWLFAEADQEKLLNDEAHLVWNMKSCSECEQWGASPIGDDGLCEECRDNAAEQLLAQNALPCPLDHRQAAQTGFDICPECGEVTAERR